MLVFDAMNCSRLNGEYVRKIRTGGVDAFHTSVIWGERVGLRATLEKLERFRVDLQPLDGEILLALSTEDIKLAKATNRIAVVLGLQNTTPIEDGVTLLAVLRHLGIRIVQLTYNERNLVGDGCKERRDAGLSDFGVRVVKALNYLRIAIDVSHAGEQTLLDAVSESSMPVICSHANSRALCDFPRNLSNTSILAIAEKGGVIGVTSIGHFVKKTSPDLEAMLDHVDHVVRLVGPDHVGIGSDLFEGRHLEVYEMAVNFAESYGIGQAFFERRYPKVPTGDSTEEAWAHPDPSWARRATGLQRVDEMPNVVEGLKRRGYDPGQIEKIMGGNFLRVLREIWGM